MPPRPEAGVLGVGDTEAVLGADKLDEGGRSGVALTIGRWLDEQQTWGLQATWFYAGDPSDELDAGWQSPGVPVLARPFFNAGLDQEDAQLVAYPNVVEGQVTAATGSYLQSVEALTRGNWRRGCRGRIDLLGGYRYLQFREGLRIEEHLISRDPGGVVQIGTNIGGVDPGEFDQIHVTGAATLDGAVGIIVVGGFLPSVGEIYPLVTFDFRTGGFDPIDGRNAGFGKELWPSYEATEFRLSVIPSTLGQFVLGTVATGATSPELGIGILLFHDSLGNQRQSFWIR